MSRNDDLVELLTAIAQQAATAFSNLRMLEQMRRQATHDALTGLPNLRLLQEQTDKAFARARRSDSAVALLFIDLDAFKGVNDTLGHASGDELLRQVSERLQAELRGSDSLARIGGDEFVVLLPELEAGEWAEEVAGRLLARLKEPFWIRELQITIGGSIGIALYPDHGTSYDELLKAADAAMYLAKSAGGGRRAVAESPPLVAGTAG